MMVKKLSIVDISGGEKLGRSSQRKGADGERELSAILQEAGFSVTRGESQSYGTVPDLSGLPGIHVEVKRVERLNVEEAMIQAERDAARFGDGAPTVFHRRNRSRWMVTMRLDTWLRLYRAFRKLCRPGSGS